MKRYDHGWDTMDESMDGDFVTIEDYKKLQAEFIRMENAWRRECAVLRRTVGEFANELEVHRLFEKSDKSFLHVSRINERFTVMMAGSDSTVTSTGGTVTEAIHNAFKNALDSQVEHVKLLSPF